MKGRKWKGLWNIFDKSNPFLKGKSNHKPGFTEQVVGKYVEKTIKEIQKGAAYLPDFPTNFITPIKKCDYTNYVGHNMPTLGELHEAGKENKMLKKIPSWAYKFRSEPIERYYEFRTLVKILDNFPMNDGVVLAGGKLLRTIHGDKGGDWDFFCLDEGSYRKFIEDLKASGHKIKDKREWQPWGEGNGYAFLTDLEKNGGVPVQVILKSGPSYDPDRFPYNHLETFDIECCKLATDKTNIYFTHVALDDAYGKICRIRKMTNRTEKRAEKLVKRGFQRVDSIKEWEPESVDSYGEPVSLGLKTKQNEVTLKNKEGMIEKFTVTSGPSSYTPNIFLQFFSKTGVQGFHIKVPQNLVEAKKGNKIIKEYVVPGLYDKDYVIVDGTYSIVTCLEINQPKLSV